MKPYALEEKDFKYSLPNENWFVDCRRHMDEFVSKLMNKVDFENYEIETNYIALGNVFIRLDERADYFLYFHSTDEPMHMSCEKEVALIAYWVVKYKPFRVKTITREEDFYCEYKCSISDVIAAMLIVSYLCEKNSDFKDFFTAKKINTLIYDLHNRDISKESMIMYVESFVKEVTIKKTK